MWDIYRLFLAVIFMAANFSKELRSRKVFDKPLLRLQKWEGRERHVKG